MKDASKEKNSSSSSASDTTANKAAAAASFKKLQPEEFYRHHIDKVRQKISKFPYLACLIKKSPPHALQQTNCL